MQVKLLVHTIQKKNHHHHHCCKLKQRATPLKNTAVQEPKRERICFDLSNPLTLLSFQDSEVKITPYLPAPFQFPVSGETELRDDHNKMR